MSVSGRLSSVLLACGFVFLSAAPLWAPAHPQARQPAAESAPSLPATATSPTSSWTITISGQEGSTVLPLPTEHNVSTKAARSADVSSDRLPGWAAFLWVTAFMLSAGLWIRSAFSLRVTLTATEVVVKNMFKSYRLPLAEISSVAGGYYGTVFTLRDGTRVTAWGVPKSNLARWTNTETRADQLAEAVITAARNAD